MVLTTHHMDEAETLCERVAIMDHGKILKIGPPAALVRELDQSVRISIESGQISLDEARALAAGADGTMVADDGTSLTLVTSEPAIILAALADRRALAGLRAQGGSLEDVFLELTGREYRA